MACTACALACLVFDHRQESSWRLILAAVYRLGPGQDQYCQKPWPSKHILRIKMQKLTALASTMSISGASLFATAESWLIWQLGKCIRQSGEEHVSLLLSLICVSFAAKEIDMSMR